MAVSTVLSEVEAGVSLKRRLLSPQTSISLLVLAALAVLLATRVDIGWSETWEVVSTLHPGWYAAAIFTHYLTFLFRGARWQILLGNAQRNGGGPPPTLFYAARVILMSWFANSVTWFRMGDAYRAYVYAKDTNTSFPRSMGTVLADRVIDLSVVAFLITAGVGVLLVGGQIKPPLFLAALAGGLLVAVAAGLTGMVLARRWVIPRLPLRVQTFYQRFHSGTMDSFGRMHLVGALGIAAWLCEAGRLFFVVMSLGTPVALGLVLFVPMANGLLTAVPLTPGGLGVVESGVTGLLRLELAFETAIAVTLVDRTISFLSTVVFGGAVFTARQIEEARRGSADRLAKQRAAQEPS